MNAHTMIGTSFSEELDRLAQDGNVYSAAPSEEWRQGRTLFGGLLAALAVTAARRACRELPPLRSAQFAYIAPATGDLELAPRLLRQGKSAAFVEVHATSGADPVLDALLLYGAPRRSSHCFRSLPMPEASRPDTLPEFFDADFVPRFSRQFDARRAGGARPVSGAAKPEVLLWVRHRDEGAPDTLASILALGDVPPPAAMTMFATPAPISTITWSVDILADRFTGAGWHLIQVEAETVGEGYSSQRMTLWDQAGTPLLAARQTVAIFG